ncbi:MAG: DUF3320 domain-containing protein [Parvibaculum sp.]
MTAEEPVISIRDRLLKERHSLLDLSTRNRLLNTPLRTRNNRAIEIVDEKAEEVFRLLTSGKPFSFLPGAQLSEEEKADLDPEDNITGGIPQPDDGETVDERGVAARHSDTRLQTRLTSEGLQKRLFDVWYDAQTLEQEQGVNILYLALGLLRWFDSDSSEIQRHAPLVLLPVTLERTSAADRFKLRWREEAPSPNLTLQAKMRAEFGLVIEDFKDEDEVDLTGYYAKVAETVAKKSRWEVLPDAMVLGFFSFSKFLMYRDLNPDNWPDDTSIEKHGMISALLRDGFPESVPLVPDNADIDDVIKPLELHHVVDADSSQTVVIAEAAGGRSLVVKGPPGTGKSQTITNVIAAAVARGKKVLFVAEKMAALEVVHRRLRQVGLGPLTLELHSNKANKRAILEELKRTRDAQHRQPRGDITIIQKLGETSDSLNAFARKLHTPLTPCELTPQKILGQLTTAQKTGGPAGFKLDGAEEWCRADVEKRKAVLRDVAERRRAIGVIPEHVWRGVRRGALDPVERAEIEAKVRRLADMLAQLDDCAHVASGELGAPDALTVAELSAALRFLNIAPLPVGLDRSSLTHAAWADPETLQDVLAAGRAHVYAEEQADKALNEVGRRADYNLIRSVIVTKGASFLRFFSGEYRAQVSLLRSYLKGPLPKAQADQIALIDLAISAQNAERAFQSAASLGTAFGAAWRGSRSDWELLNSFLTWRRKNDDLPEEVWGRIAKGGVIEKVEEARLVATRLLPDFEQELAKLIEELDLDTKRAFDTGDAKSIYLRALADRLTDWLGDMEGLSHFITFASRTRELSKLGISSLADGLHDGLLDHASLMSAFDQAYANVLRVALFKTWPELREFDGDGHNNLVTSFRRFDKARIDLAQEQIVASHAEGRPRGAAGIGPLGVLNAEIARKRGHLPIRVLLEKAGAAIQQLKPVFMMSPLSVAQFLKPGSIEFDLLVMDEASQIEPVDALGSVARAQQIVVVGDERQLPPTAFFKKLTGEEDPEEDDEGVLIQAKDAESILDLALAKGVPYRMLSWHYRSKHQSLIAVSNKEFYENKLFIVPSPYDAIAGMGLKFNLMKNTSYDRGGTRTNPGEARAVAEAVIHHARTCPEQTLGIATFSVSQRQAILKELELLRRANPDLEEFFSSASHEPFFVKNLENIQGDERDVIFISIGYGKTETGYLSQSFGPLNREGGERRLNVLISRAKQRCEVFCNFTGADIDLERTRARGVAALKMFLTFAETGHFGLGESTGADFDSDFERDVCERLQALGYDVKRQIGASGFRVDLAISDSEKPGRFVLGIECDGAQYHASRSARDRDRLRQQVLEAHGWIIHRIWSADWYLRPQAEMKKIEDAIAGAKAEWAARDEEGFKSRRAVPVSFEGENVDDVDVVTAVVGGDEPQGANRHYYLEANFPVRTEIDPHNAPLSEMAGYVAKIVEIEGPIHLDEIVTRIRMLWGLARAGSRIREAVERAIHAASQNGRIRGETFFTAPGQTVVVRDRSLVASISLRKPEMLPPAEVELALMEIVEANFGAGRDDLIQAAARAFGFSSTSAQLRSVLSEAVQRLSDTGRLIERGGLLVQPK